LAIAGAACVSLVYVLTCVRVDLLGSEQGNGAVCFRCHVDLHGARNRRPPIAVGQHDAYQATGQRIARTVAIGQAFDDRLDGVCRRVGVELDNQVDAILAVKARDKRPDRHPAKADCAVCRVETDLTGSGALMPEAEVV